VATTLQRLLNVEGYPILSLTDDDRTLRLDVARCGCSLVWGRR